MHGEAQLVVVPAGERQLARPLLPERPQQRLGHRHGAEGNLHARAARVRELAGIPEQSVGHVDAGAGVAAQPLPERHARRRQQEALAQVRERVGGRSQTPLLQSQSRGRIPRCAGDEQRIPGPPTAAPQRLAPRYVSEQLHRHAQGTARRVPADQRHLVRTRQRAKSGGKLRQPVFVGIRQREREQRPGGSGPHRRKVAEVHGERPVADGRGR